MTPRSVWPLALCLAAGLLASCTRLSPRDIVLEDTARQQQLRTIQTHSFAVGDRIRILRAIIATLQDLDFVIDRADSQLGFISATKLDGYSLEISVLVDQAEPGRMLVRAGLDSPTYMYIPFAPTPSSLEDSSYQAFFASLEKNLFP